MPASSSVLQCLMFFSIRLRHHLSLLFSQASSLNCSLQPRHYILCLQQPSCQSQTKSLLRTQNCAIRARKQPQLQNKQGFVSPLMSICTEEFVLPGTELKWPMLPVSPATSKSGPISTRTLSQAVMLRTPALDTCTSASCKGLGTLRFT